MDVSKVEQDLNARIEQSRGWLQGNPSPLENFIFCDQTWTATPNAFLDNAERIERHGVAFKFSREDPSRPVNVQLHIRIKPEVSVGPKRDSPPYVVTYIVNQTSGSGDAITWQFIKTSSSYKDLIGITIIEWYRRWIEHALVSNGAAKILKPEMAIHY